MTTPNDRVTASTDAELRFGGPVSYILKSAGDTMLALGQMATLPDGPLATLAERTAQFFASRTGGPDVLVGALPFDLSKPAYLFQPARVFRIQGQHGLDAIPGLEAHDAPASPAPGTVVAVEPEPSAGAFKDSVAASLAAMAASDIDLRKIVLSRSLKVTATEPFSATTLVQRLSRDESVTVFATPLPPLNGEPRVLVGATPELLLDKRGGHVASHPLAGSARRHADPEADRRAAEGLLASEKDRKEHAIVVESILDLLAPYCAELPPPGGPTLRQTATMWHLGTRIEGRLKDPTLPSEVLAALLHPTPAVCGLPQRRAHEAIEQLESYDRAFYAGAVGWCDAAGDGRWYVSIRCAELEGDHARLYAGAGIVPGSTPEGELAETAAKFHAMLDGFDIDGSRFGI